MDVRAACPADIPAIMAVEGDAPTAAHWRADDYARIFAAGAPRRVALVAEEEAQVRGFVVALCAGPEWELENIAVAAGAQRRGLGTRLTLALLEEARAAGAAAVWLEVRESNTAARGLYEKWGFVESGRRRAYYSQPAEDAVLYRFTITAGEAANPPKSAGIAPKIRD
jgi:ribosomal-protein-alanine N-acetyltransferase